MQGACFSFHLNKDTDLSQVFADLKNCVIRAAVVRCLQRDPSGSVSVTFRLMSTVTIPLLIFVHPRHRNSPS